MSSPLVQAGATLIGAAVALGGLLIVQSRTAAASRGADEVKNQRDSLAAFLGAAELVLDDVRELWRANDERDAARRALVWPRYFEHWSDLVRGYALVRLHGPDALAESAKNVRGRIGDFCEVHEAYIKPPKNPADRKSNEDWDGAERVATEATQAFREKAIAAIGRTRR